MNLKEQKTKEFLQDIAIKYFNDCGIADLYFLNDICQDFEIEINDLFDRFDDFGYQKEQIHINLAINIVYEMAIEAELDRLEIYDFDWQNYINNGIYFSINCLASNFMIEHEIITCKEELEEHLINFIREKDKEEVIDNLSTEYEEEVPYEYTQLSLDLLSRQKTICESQCDDLKIENNLYKVWLSRMSVEDGMPYNNEVTIERLDKNDYKWKEIYKYQAK